MLCNRENTHLTTTRGRGTPGYSAPELRMPNFSVIHKCDVYCFGMLLFEIIGRRRNLALNLSKARSGFQCGLEKKNREITERMVNVALLCVQYKPDSRPIMSDVVKMLEGSVENPKPLNPFQPFMDGNFTSHLVQMPLTYITDTSDGLRVIEAVIVFVVIAVKVGILICVCRRRNQTDSRPVIPGSKFLTLAIDKFLNDMEREKPIRFTDQQLRIATDNYSNLLGSGGFGTVYKGIFTNGTMVAVKVLRGSSDKKIEEQFMAEVGTIGRIHHFNLVRLYGFCFEKNLIALVYEYMGNGSLDKYLFHERKTLGYEKLHEIAVGTARGIAYLHEECRQRIIHYDIKPGNILLDRNFNPKVADFGLAKLCNKDNTHITMTGGRGTPGYAAPELWMPFPITHKCDVYSFGMLLFEIIGRRRNLDIKRAESQEWFPIWVWKRFDTAQLGELIIVCGIEEKSKEIAERMIKIALWCVQYRPELRPIMSVVVKMLEGSLEVPEPGNPFQHLMGAVTFAHPVQDSQTYNTTTTSSGSFVMVTNSSIICATPIMRKYEIELASRNTETDSSSNMHFLTLAMDKFLSNMEREKPIRFTSEQLRIATDNYSSLLGSGGFGEVYKGNLSDGITVAVKVLRGNSDKRIEEQFMAEVGTIGKVHHFNLVQLIGFCFERDLRALVYEYMENGSLDRYLFHEKKTLGYEKLYEIAVGIARGIAYLHEDCKQRIIHYDIKPGNILLDRNFNPKVADFGLAKLCNRDNTHITMTGGRGTPGYAAPELWMPFPVTHKCDVYSYGMLLFEIVGRRRNVDTNLPESQEWFPVWVWKRFDAGELVELRMACGIEERHHKMAERMVKVALLCVQYRPDSRPIMSDVVKMLEGSVEISKPMNPFQHMMDGTIPGHSAQASQTDANTIEFSSVMICLLCRCYKRSKIKTGSSLNTFLTLIMDKFLSNMEKEKPMRYTGEQLRIATDNYTTVLGSGCFGEGRNHMAVKVLRGNSDKRIEEQLMAELGTIGKIHHFNVVQLCGFCFDRNLRALVYEYIGNGSLDNYLFHENKTLGYEKLHEIAVGTARGIAYLHEDCKQRIIHYDIKTGNILLDNKRILKLLIFGLAKLCSRENTHITMTGGRVTPGYAAPEIWMPFPVTHKCDVYSYGVLLFEIIGRRRNLDINLRESQEWFSVWVWKKIDAGELGELIKACGIKKRHEEMAKRMVKVALLCVQYMPVSRPIMSYVVKMLEGSAKISKPSNPFQYGTFPAH
ncbi:LEAF RUST 10 DISEASE-RESISTANCE LOCUS RECEPTOR-LIKE PROTEIN KINASE-like 2.2 [Glycine max]|nr:LEAF RUST 10 DISEASE-RESISTANCE LOCUS RECEPTOR-LIKE PROTEIN KINASE-like 2.2 [Glycine max]